MCECQFGTRFNTTVLVAFEAAEEFVAFQEDIKDAFLIAPNGLCDQRVYLYPDFRQRYMLPQGQM